jgi:glucosamine--fructose-6-phosphate aminotransferase (isomerizing)
MCGIFGVIGPNINRREVSLLSSHAKQRGKDSSGLVLLNNKNLTIFKSDSMIDQIKNKIKYNDLELVLGHSRLVTNGYRDNQPLFNSEIILLHNGIVVNDSKIWKNLSENRKLEVDSEVIIAIANEELKKGSTLDAISKTILNKCQGIVSVALFFPNLRKLLLLSNNGSLYFGGHGQKRYFSSEKYPLLKLGCENVKQILDSSVIFDTPEVLGDVNCVVRNESQKNIVPNLNLYKNGDKLLEFQIPKLTRCSKCILPETMPFIKFDEFGVCNYCLSYKIKNQPRKIEELIELVEPYKKAQGADCIVPFSGGRDSSHALHIIVNELGMKPITFTYDWAMVTDLARRNISRMCSQLKVENIIIAEDIQKKRKFISKNLTAWLKAPNLGMLSILTAGDKHFFRYVETVKKQTGVDLNLWGINPLEVTHFKSGFLGIPPDFADNNVYTRGGIKQLRYQKNRLKAMLESPGYFNSSLWDTLSGEYYRSFRKKTDYFHIYDFFQWDEKVVDDTLKNYSWELAPDTNTTWRIGDGTAAFYNYVYYTVAGFTEHDTFRSNQIREGQISREEALKIVERENYPRYQNIKWYLDVLNHDFEDTITIVNNIPKRYNIN